MVNVAPPERQLSQAVIALNIADLDNRNRCQQQLQQHQQQQEKSQSGGFHKLIKRRLRTRNVIDVAIVIIVASILLIIELGIVPNTKLGFICKDPTISYPFRGDTISSTTLMVGSFFGPIFFIFLVEILRERSFKRVCVGTVWNYYKECLIGATLILVITEVTKVIVGEPRPHFFDTCEPDSNMNCKPGTFILDYNCTNDGLSNYSKTDVTRSFPSGHTSISMFVALFCSYLVQIRIPSVSVTKLTKPLLIAMCLTWSALCSLTRITDRRHHWWDVLGGAFLGVFGAWYMLMLLHSREKASRKLVRSDTSTTTLLDVKNKDATSVVI